jgi:hypothetical protein
MFAPKIAKPRTKAAESPTGKVAPQRSMRGGHRFGQDPVGQSLLLQRTVGNQARLRLLAQRTSSLTESRSGGDDHEQEADSPNLTIRGAGPSVSWDFSKIPLFAPDRANLPQARSALIAATRSDVIQPKLTVGDVNDPLEQEADRVADQVLQMPKPQLQRDRARGGACPECQTEQPHTGHRCLEIGRVHPGDPGRTPAPPIVHEILRSPGQPLSASTCAFFEPRLGRDFNDVRVHTDERASESARAVNALAYTVGQHIVFGRGQYKSNSTDDRLLAHELTHVVQQLGRTETQQEIGVPYQSHTRRVGGATKSVVSNNHEILETDSSARAVQLAPAPPENAGTAIKFGPLTVGRGEADIHRRQMIKREAWGRLPGVARSFVDEFFAAAEVGARTATKPEDPIAKENFNRALAGNLLWAATSLFADWHPVVIAMSFIGASVGTGVGSSAEDVIGLGERIIADRLAEEADKLETESISVAHAVADECGERLYISHDDQDQLLWRTMFPRSSSGPGIPWETRRATLTKFARQRVEGALGSFERQWEEWKGRIDDCARTVVGRGNVEEIAQAGPGGSVTTGTLPLQTAVVQRQEILVLPPVPFRRSRKQCEAQDPFRPVLKF